MIGFTRASSQDWKAGLSPARESIQRIARDCETDEVTKINLLIAPVPEVILASCRYLLVARLAA